MAPHINNFELGQHGRNRSNVWTYPAVNTFRTGRLDDLGAHPTVKPAAMVADAMKDCSRRGDIVLDTFMGSGTTILAAEKVGRRAYGLEIDPLYVDVAIRRWQQFTKRDAVLAATGETFDEVVTARSAKPARRPEMSDERKRPKRIRFDKPRKTSGVGFGQPPREHQFKPGQSGNPKGRHKGSKNESTILREILQRKIATRSDRGSRRIPILEGILLRITEDALRGNTKSATFVLNRYAALVSGELQAQDLSEDDREVLEAFAKRFAQQNKASDT